MAYHFSKPESVFRSQTQARFILIREIRYVTRTQAASRQIFFKAPGYENRGMDGDPDSDPMVQVGLFWYIPLDSSSKTDLETRPSPSPKPTASLRYAPGKPQPPGPPPGGSQPVTHRTGAVKCRVVLV